jgi:hypothetical protein
MILMSERKYAPIDTDDALQVVEAQVAEMPDAELQKVKAKFDAEHAKRTAKKPDETVTMSRQAFAAKFGYDRGW